MNLKRLLLALAAFALLLPLSGAGCRRNCCPDARSFAPPPDPCCNGAVVPAPAPFIPAP
jgi:hypothetical protein